MAEPGEKRQNIFENIILLLSIFLVLGLYWRWSLSGVITWGDWLPIFKGTLSDYSLSLWNTSGLGSFIIQGVPFQPMVVFQGFLYRIFQWNPAFLQRLVIFCPLVFFLIISPWYLARTLGYGKIGIAATIIVFNLNTIVFLIAGVTTFALAIAISPLVVAAFIQTLNHQRMRYGLLFVLIFSLQMVYEIRFAYITAIFCGFYFAYFLAISLVNHRHNLVKLGQLLSIMALLILFLHSYWLIPFFVAKSTGATIVALPEGYSAVGWVRTLSYWNLLHVLGLQLPWWGEPDIVNPPNPQFLLLPILAFSVFLFSIPKQKRMLLFFGLAALIISFLAKGSKPPFGEVYIWLFLHFPGFNMFREPGKWWFPVVICYAVLIGGLVNHLITRENMNQVLNWFKNHFNIPHLVTKISLVAVAIGAFFVIFPVQPISTLQYSGIFDPRPVPEESNHIEHFLESRSDFFRVLWLPALYRFGYFSSQHPALQGVEVDRKLLSRLVRDNPDPCSYLGQHFSTFFLRLFAVKYVIVPSAPEEIPHIYYWYERPPEYYHQLAKKTPGLQPVHFRGKSQLYEVPDPLPHLYIASDSVRITDDDISFFSLINTIEVLRNTPLFLLENQISEKNFKNINSLVFRDSNWQDLAIQFCRLASWPVDQLDKKKFEIKEKGIYELYLDVSELEGEIPEFDIEIDGKVRMLDIRFSMLGKDRKYVHSHRDKKVSNWVRIFGVELKKGKHNIKSKIKNENLKMEKQNIKLVLVNKEERERIEKLVWKKINKPASKLCYIFSKDREFYLPRESDYIVKARVLPRFVRKRQIGQEISFGKEEIANWFTRVSGVTYDYSISESGVLILSSYFDGDKKEDEFVQISNETVRIDLKKYPYFDLTYRIENPKVQTIEVVAGIDFDKNGEVDEYIRGIYPRPASIVWTDFSYNLFSKVKAEFPDKKHYELINLELYPHKLWGVDCSGPERRDRYKFWVKGLQFFSYSPRGEFLKLIKDGLDIDLNSEGELKKWSLESKQEGYALKTDGEILTVAKPLTYLELSRPIDKIDLRQFPMVKLEYSAEESNFQNIKLILDLDFDGDAVIDKNIFLDCLLTSKGKAKFQIDAYKLAKNVYPDKKEYNLIQIRLRLNEVDSFYLNRLKVYSYSLVSPVDFVFNRPVFEIDGREYWLKTKFEDKEDTEELWFEQIIHLEKGEHHLGKLEDDTFEVEWVVIEPVHPSTSSPFGEASLLGTGSSYPNTLTGTNGHKQSIVHSRKEPEIKFKKVNSSKYQVKVKGAREPFWLVFNESFHGQWKLYPQTKNEKRKTKNEEIVAEFPKLGVKEIRHSTRFSFRDIKCLFRKPLDADHQLVNLYANGWYIEPERLGLTEDFTLIIYFWPQSLFYIGLMISSFTFIGCVAYLGWAWRKRKMQ